MSNVKEKTVMVVEDCDQDYFLIKRSLKKCDVENIIHCSSGECALKELKKAHVDLVILDINLSKNGLSGLDVLHEIRTDKKTKDIKVVVMSANLEMLQLCGEADLSFRKHNFTSLMNYTFQAVELLK